MCVCGHDIFVHDMQVIALQNIIMATNATNKMLDPINIKVGKCHENNMDHYTCKCKQFNSIDIWMNQLWKEFQQYAS